LNVSEKKYSITSTYIVSRLRSFLPALYSKTIFQIPKYDADNTFKLLNFHDQELTLDLIFEIRKQNALEKEKKLEIDPKGHVGFKGD
jgi:hypothetical protein